ncbi:hypothetical protein H9P43_000548 [Blastocladiella emersonii ATCC 22665]|nr:hypothetical protein H9P43_000548 [Blastocladiella emersonii ATCC 22665]
MPSPLSAFRAPPRGYARVGCATLLLVLSAVYHIAGIMFLVSVPSSFIAYGLLAILVPSILLSFYLYPGWHRTQGHAARDKGHAAAEEDAGAARGRSSTDAPAPQRRNDGVPRGLRVFGLDPATIQSRPRSASTSSADPLNATSSQPRRRSPGSSPINGSVESLVRGLDELQVRSGSDADLAAPGSPTSFPRGSPTPDTDARKSRVCVRWIDCRKLVVVNLVLQVAWLLVCAYIIFAPRVLLDLEPVQFVRVGETSPTAVNLQFRVRAASRVAVQYRAINGSSATAATAAAWTTLPPITVAAESDFTATARITGLAPATAYEYFLIDADRGTRFPESEFLSGRIKTPRAVTSTAALAAAEAADSQTPYLSIAFGSCIKPSTPPLLERGIRGFRELLSRPELRADLLLFLGDFIYADVPFRYGTTIDHYRWHYKYAFSVPETRALLSSVPTYFVYDDHEILNNWDRGESTAPFPAASQAYAEYVGRANPVSAAGADRAYYNFTTAPVCYFVVDLRRYRTPPAQPDSVLLGAEQTAALHAWLEDSVDPARGCQWRVLASSVPMTTNWHIDADTWVGYRAERDALLNWIHDRAIPNVVVVSGDRHTVGVQKLRPHAEVVEFSSSPISQFYPPLNFYDPNGGDEALFDASVGNVKIGMLDVFWDRLVFRQFINDRIVFNYTVEAAPQTRKAAVLAATAAAKP